MLKALRVALAILFFLGITFLFVDITSKSSTWLDWLTYTQLIPAIFAGSVLSIIILALLTLIFGRIYCSVICPLGVVQDIIGKVSSIFMSKRKRKLRFNYSNGFPVLRYTVFSLFCIAMILGTYFIGLKIWASFIEPYTVYGRMASTLMAPAYEAGNNMLADIAASNESTFFWQSKSSPVSTAALWASVVTLAVLIVTVVAAGRLWCNTICPAGTLLGFLSRFSLFAPVLDNNKCTHCRSCEHKCKAQCIEIDKSGNNIDYSRCVVCFNCLYACKLSGVKYTFRFKQKKQSTSVEKQGEAKPLTDATRRSFLLGAVTLGGAAIASAQKMTDGGLAPIVEKKNPQRKTPVVPPGAKSVKNFYSQCTACQLCVSACPNAILVPSTSIDNLMQPTMNFDNGYCRPECVRCSQICPTGAIHPISVPEKTDISIGQAWLDFHACLAVNGIRECGNCARHCPVDAITMVPLQEEGAATTFPPRRPVIDESRCIGCGSCENICPVNPVSAIRVEGREIHTSLS